MENCFLQIVPSSSFGTVSTSISVEKTCPSLCTSVLILSGQFDDRKTFLNLPFFSSFRDDLVPITSFPVFISFFISSIIWHYPYVLFLSLLILAVLFRQGLPG